MFGCGRSLVLQKVDWGENIQVHRHLFVGKYPQCLRRASWPVPFCHSCSKKRFQFCHPHEFLIRKAWKFALYLSHISFKNFGFGAGQSKVEAAAKVGANRRGRDRVQANPARRSFSHDLSTKSFFLAFQIFSVFFFFECWHFNPNLTFSCPSYKRLWKLSFDEFDAESFTVVDTERAQRVEDPAVLALLQSAWAQAEPEMSAALQRC